MTAVAVMSISAVMSVVMSVVSVMVAVMSAVHRPSKILRSAQNDKVHGVMTAVAVVAVSAVSAHQLARFFALLRMTKYRA